MSAGILPENKRYVCPKCGFVSDTSRFLTVISECWVTDGNGQMRMEQARSLLDKTSLQLIEIICIECGTKAEVKDK